MTWYYVGVGANIFQIGGPITTLLAYSYDPITHVESWDSGILHMPDDFYLCVGGAGICCYYRIVINCITKAPGLSIYPDLAGTDNGFCSGGGGQCCLVASTVMPFMKSYQNFDINPGPPPSILEPVKCFAGSTVFAHGVLT